MKKSLSLVLSCYKLVEKRASLISSWALRMLLTVLSFVASYFYTQLLQSIIRNEKLSSFLVIISISLFALQLITEAVLFFLELHFEKDNRVRIKSDLLRKMLMLAPDTKELTHSSKNTEIIYSDVNNITSLLMSGWTVLMNILSVICATALIVHFNIHLLLPIVCIVLLESAIIILTKGKIKRYNQEIRNDTDINYKLIRDVLLDYRSVQIDNASSFFGNKFASEANAIIRKIKSRDIHSFMVSTGIKAINFLTVILIIFLCTTNIRSGSDNILFLIICSRILISSISQLIVLVISLQPQFISVERVFSLINLQDNRGNMDKEGNSHEIRLSDVSFSYGESEVIRHFSYDFDQNGLYIIKGKNGSGKTTLLNLLAGVLLPSGGAVMWDGEETGRYRYASLSDKISYLSQYDVVYDLSLLENILFSASVPSDQEQAFKNRISRLCDVLGFEYEEADNRQGTGSGTLSFGQQRKICLLRTFIQDRDIIILDEPLTGLDIRTRNELFKLFEEMSRSKIIIIATHEDIESDNIRDVIQLS